MCCQTIIISLYGYFFLRSKRLAAAKINLMKSLTELPVVCVYVSVGGWLSGPG